MNKRNLKQKNTIPFTLVSKKMRCLGLDLKKKTYLRSIQGNYKTLLRHTTKLNKWRNNICSWIGRLKTVKMFIIHNLIYKSSEKKNRKPRSRSPLIFNKTDL